MFPHHRNSDEVNNIPLMNLTFIHTITFLTTVSNKSLPRLSLPISSCISAPNSSQLTHHTPEYLTLTKVTTMPPKDSLSGLADVYRSYNPSSGNQQPEAFGGPSSVTPTQENVHRTHDNSGYGFCQWSEHGPLPPLECGPSVYGSAHPRTLPVLRGPKADSHVMIPISKLKDLEAKAAKAEAKPAASEETVSGWDFTPASTPRQEKTSSAWTNSKGEAWSDSREQSWSNTNDHAGAKITQADDPWSTTEAGVQNSKSSAGVSAETWALILQIETLAAINHNVTPRYQPILAKFIDRKMDGLEDVSLHEVNKDKQLMIELERLSDLKDRFHEGGVQSKEIDGRIERKLRELLKKNGWTDELITSYMSWN